VSKPPSWNEIRTNAQQFATRWEGTSDENAESQSFWNEFLGIFGIDRKRVATFEARAKRESTGGRGRIDLLWPGTLVAEHKSAGKDLATAEAQAIDYLESIDTKDFPGVIVTSDFGNFRVRDLGGDNIPFTFPLADLPKEIDRFGFIAGYKQRKFGDKDEVEANVKAAKLMGNLYEELARTGYEGHDASVLMTRLLFLMFGDDTGMWEKGLFSEFVDTRTQEDGSDLGAQLAMLFQVLDKAETSRPATMDELLLRFPYVNGHLFTNRIDIPTFDKRMRDELVRCAEFDWSKISPAVFGSLFQAVKSKESRRTLGEHYTTEHNILRALAPLFLDGLWEEFESVKDNINRLEKFHDKIANIKVLDPACGCGNFLVIAYRELRRLELAVLVQIDHLRGGTHLLLDVSNMVRVRLSNFYGIELEEWPAKIAETAMFLVDQQANHALAAQFGQAPDRLPIMNAANVTVANALETDWASILPPAECSYIVGNPPFVGARLQTPGQRESQQLVWKKAPRSGLLDYVTNWFVLAARYMQGTSCRAALVSTNSITQGEQPALLWQELGKCNAEIAFAHRSFEWESEASDKAAVHVVIIGFTCEALKGKRVLFHHDRLSQETSVEAGNINAYLVDGPNVLVESRRNPFVSWIPPMEGGNKPRDGGFISSISPEEAETIRNTDPIAAQYLRRIYGAREHLQSDERWCLWLVDASPSDMRSSPVLRARVQQVLDERTGKPDAKGAAAATPALFAYVNQPTEDFMMVPSVSSGSRKYIPIGIYGPENISTNAVFTISNADHVLFGMLSSALFTTWVETVSARLKSDYQISVTSVYNTFPFPDRPNDAEVAKIEKAVKEVLEARAQYPAATLAELYDPLSMPASLVAAHANLDSVIDVAVSGKRLKDQAERQQFLFARYAELTADLLTITPEKKTRKKKA
jgi:hypothetical protein